MGAAGKRKVSICQRPAWKKNISASRKSSPEQMASPEGLGRQGELKSGDGLKAKKWESQGKNW